MKDLRDLNGCDLVWRDRNGRFELSHGKDVFGTLTFRSSCGTLATAETAHGKWTFKRVGFLNPMVTAREAGSEKQCAHYHPRFYGGGQLVLSDGLTLGWKANNFWQTQWSFVDSDDAKIVGFSPDSGSSGCSELFRTGVTVSVGRSAMNLETLALLVSLGFYLIYLSNQDTEAATIAAVTAAVI